MPSPGPLPQAIIGRFRTASLDRLARVEAAWIALTRGSHDGGLADELARELHTLKGDARVVGHTSVHALCEKVEDVLAVARAHRFRVSDDLGILATMAFQFLGLLLRKQPGAPLSGVDLGGFVEQIDETLRELGPAPDPETRSSRPPEPPPPSSGNESVDRLGVALRHRLATGATDVFLEYLQARGPSRHRLHAAWQRFSTELSHLEAAPLAPLLARHVESARRLADDLGKRAEIVLSLGGATIGGDAAEAIDLAVMHAIRNAVDHGIEAPEERRAAGKREVGRIAIRARKSGDFVDVTVEDDGAGVDLERVRGRAVSAGFWDAERAQVASERELVDLLFQPRFTTRDQASPVSGRGIGLDAIRSVVAGVDGAVSATTLPGRGMTLTMRVPRVRTTAPVHTFLASRGDVLLAVSVGWAVSAQRAGGSSALAADPLGLLGVEPAYGPLGGEAATQMCLELRRGDRVHAVVAGSGPTRATAIRLCVTDAADPVEIVSVCGAEALLLRPERMAWPQP